MKKKGFVGVSKYDKDETIWLTQKGAEAYANVLVERLSQLANPEGSR